MAKFAIKKNRTHTQPVSQTATTIANSTPLAKALGEYIMTKARQVISTTDSESEEQQIHTLFKTFAKDNYTDRLAKVVELLTGIKPNYNVAPFEFGDVVYDSSDYDLYVVVGVSGGVNYAINASATSYRTYTSASTYVSTYVSKANLTQTATYTKSLLKTQGSVILTFVNRIFGTPIAEAMLKVLDFSQVI